MTSQHTYRFALFICFLLVGEEIASAKHLNNQENNEDIEPNTDKADDSDDYTTEELNQCIKLENKLRGARSTIPHPIMDQLHCQSLKEEGGGKKDLIGFASRILKSDAIKRLLSTSYGLPPAKIAKSLQKNIDECSDAAHPETSSYSKKYEQASKNVVALSKKAERFQLEADRTQSVIQIIIDLLSPILEALENIDTAQDKLIKFDRDGDDAAWQAKEKILDLITEKDEGDIPFVEVDKLYQNTFQNVINNSASAWGIAIPGLSTVYEHAVYKSRMRRLGNIELKEHIEFKLPKKSNSLYEATKFNQWMSRRWRKKSRATDLITDLKNTFKPYFEKSNDLSLKCYGAIGSVANLAKAGNSIYKKIGIKNDCKDTRQKIKCAYIQSKESEKRLQAHMDEFKDAKDNMMEAWGVMRGNLTDEMLLKSLKEIGSMLTGAAKMQNVKADIDRFLDGIKTSDDSDIRKDLHATQNLMALKKIPFFLECFARKIHILNRAVFRPCKDGSSSMDDIIKNSKEPEYLESGQKSCADVIGYLYMKDDHIKKAWYKVADEQGYHRLCLMNSDINREYICNHKAENAEKIAKRMEWGKDGVQEVLNVLKKSFSPRQHRFICIARKYLKKDKGKLETELKDKFQGYKLEDLYALKCPAPKAKEKEKCIPDDVFSPKQLERENRTG